MPHQLPDQGSSPKVILKTLPNELLALPRQVPRNLRNLPLIHHFLNQLSYLLKLRKLPRISPSRHLDHQTTQRPHIWLTSQVTPLHYLRSHPRTRALYTRVYSWLRLRTSQVFRTPKISKFEVTLFILEDVTAFEVPVDYFILIQILKSLQNLHRKLFQ